jgi:hypothetical protein
MPLSHDSLRKIILELLRLAFMEIGIEALNER